MPSPRIYLVVAGTICCLGALLFGMLTYFFGCEQTEITIDGEIESLGFFPEDQAEKLSPTSKTSHTKEKAFFGLFIGCTVCLCFAMVSSVIFKGKLSGFLSFCGLLCCIMTLLTGTITYTVGCKDLCTQSKKLDVQDKKKSPTVIGLYSMFVICSLLLFIALGIGMVMGAGEKAIESAGDATQDDDQGAYTDTGDDYGIGDRMRRERRDFMPTIREAPREFRRMMRRRREYD